MKLQIQTHPVDHYPAPVGAHGLAWSYLLDNLFADAYARNIDTLSVVLPHEGLVPLCERRAQLSGQAALPQASGGALAQLVPDQMAEDAQVDRVYSLEHGLLAPKGLRTEKLKYSNWQVDAQLFVLTWQVKLWGAAMKLLNQAQRPQLADRATFAMRRHFASATPTPSFYILRGWSPVVSAKEDSLPETDATLTSESMTSEPFTSEPFTSEPMMPNVDVSNINKMSQDD